MIPGMIDTATVYTEHASTGAYTVVARANLRCRLAHVSRQPAATATDRAELGAMRRLLWEAGYAMPEHARVEIGGVRWSIVAGTLAAYRGPAGTVTHRSADVVRAA